MMAIRRTALLLISIVLFCAPLGALSVGGFSDDPDRIELAAKSVLMLDVYDENDEYIASGSGFVAFDSGTLVTNYHVIEGADIIVGYSDDGDQYVLDKILIADEARDVAIIGFSAPTELTPLTLNADGVLKRAQTVVAIGSPIGITNTVSIGNISALYDEEGVSEIQFTAPISPGSSGGALFDDSGEVIGITSATYLDAQNINIAVHAREVLDLYAEWDGTSYANFSGDSMSTPVPTPSATPIPMPTANSERNIEIVSDRFVWSEAGRNISNGSAPTYEFDNIALETLMYEREALSYYIDLTLSMDAGIARWTTVAFEFRLSSGDELLDSIVITKSFGAYETKDVQRYFNITKLMLDISKEGTYVVTCFVGDDELVNRHFDVSLDGRTPPPATPKPTVKPTPTPQTYGELKYGDRGDDVKKMQLALIQFGYLDDEADGIFGQKTREAVVEFNIANGLSKKFIGRYSTDPEVASNEMLQLLYDGNPITYSDPAMALYFEDNAYAEWYNLSGDKIQIHFEVTNQAKYRTVKAFELYAYATDVWGNRIYGSDVIYYWTTVKTVKPGATVYSDYVTMPSRSDISTIYCGISRIVYTDGIVEVVSDDDVEYVSWAIND